MEWFNSSPDKSLKDEMKAARVAKAKAVAAALRKAMTKTPALLAASALAVSAPAAAAADSASADSASASAVSSLMLLSPVFVPEEVKAEAEVKADDVEATVGRERERKKGHS